MTEETQQAIAGVERAVTSVTRYAAEQHGAGPVALALALVLANLIHDDGGDRRKFDRVCDTGWRAAEGARD